MGFGSDLETECAIGPVRRPRPFPQNALLMQIRSINQAIRQISNSPEPGAVSCGTPSS